MQDTRVKHVERLADIEYVNGFIMELMNIRVMQRDVTHVNST